MPCYSISAIAEGLGFAKGEVGIAYIDMLQPVLRLAQFSDSNTYSKLLAKLEILNPAEVASSKIQIFDWNCVLLPDSALGDDGKMHALCAMIEEHFVHTEITSVNRKCFNEAIGLETIDRICLEECQDVRRSLDEKYYCLASTAALIDYLEKVQRSLFIPKSMRIVYEGSERSLIIGRVCFLRTGADTAKHLELITSMKVVDNVECSLFGVLNFTCTYGGARMLRASILQPSRDLSSINDRLSAIEELLGNVEGCNNLRSNLCSMRDIERSIPMCIGESNEQSPRFAEYRIKQMTLLLHTLEMVEPLLHTLESFQNGLFFSYAKVLQDDRFVNLLSTIRRYIQDDSLGRRGPLKGRNELCFTIRPNLNGLLDVFRKTYTEYVSDVEAYHLWFVEQVALPLRLSYSPSRGFYFSLTLDKDEELPPLLTDKIIKVVRKSSCLLCSTEELSTTYTFLFKMQLNERIDFNFKEIILLSDKLISELLSEMRRYMSCLYDLSEVISSLDFILSLTTRAELSNWVRPDFSDTMAISQARHPLMDCIDKSNFVPNDVYAGPDSRFIIISGPNMSGKSTYLKTVGMLQLLAQMGSFVPARIASFRLCDQLFSRICHNDSLESSSSSFMVEALVFLVTHYLDLAELDRLYPYVDSYHFEASFNSATEKLQTSHKLLRGIHAGPEYGFELAEIAMFPQEVINNAKQLLEKLRNKKKKQNEKDSCQLRKQRAVMRLRHRLAQVITMSDVENSVLLGYLNQLKKSYMEEVETIDKASNAE
ncbi:mutS protein 4 [Trichuris trichiura]|uniref:MutS protein 4 n=1 Tax=Trichuris trichiura TaxID=36087 RepID=A0A077ZB74_TRITR|nr:mutS protein 4 [Trichuris trichiura]